MKTRLLIISLLTLGGAGGIWQLFKSAEKPETQPQPVAVTTTIQKPKRVQSVAPVNEIVTVNPLASFDDASNFNPPPNNTKPN